MSKSQQRSTSPNPMKGSGPTSSTPDSAGSSNVYIVGIAVSIFVLVVCIVVIIALLRHRRKACWQRSGADKTTATNVSLHNAESHLLTDGGADGTQGVSPPNPDTNTYSVVDDEQTNPSNNGKPSSPFQPQTDVYSVVHKPDKGGQSRHQSFNTADDKSKTTDNGAAAANNEDYNTLNMRGGETQGNTTKPGSSESAGAVYSHLGSINKTAAVPSKKQPANADTSQATGNDVDAATDSGAGIYHILEESEEEVAAKPSKMNEQDEEYRSLDFAGRKGGAASEAVSGEGEGEQVYNRLRDGDGETYSHVKRDVKQQVVSDDTYSHIV
ncbi:hypothetical protein V1264_003189 [Littorina saxatilis]|uniref:Uncharacterized protein n=2 Tax=Littorina saxatilis TaxID=31220 RepID=A0AAN9B472_9CAEN